VQDTFYLEDANIILSLPLSVRGKIFRHDTLIQKECFMLNLHMPWAPKLDITKTIALLPPQVMREVDLIG
jgi:hypothetical protein